ncbi:hypothetical protein NPIL_488071 [Nephila pilipes]|uniref:Uncharacterized protein n=1 Tax=Nephila pilipes TaxID=299642 RepID=A0A8X6P1Q2_NEPPI|nr:hypothetical protein NPIL_488071 [Nephila pilipes]
MNVLQVISFKNLEEEICPSGMNLTVEDHTLGDEVLQAAIEEDSSLMYGELSKQLNISDEAVRLHLHLLGKTYRLRK